MARVADYRTISDGPIVVSNESHFPSRTFTMPQGFHSGSRSVLFFSLAKPPDIQLDLKIFINGAGSGAAPAWRLVLNNDATRVASFNEMLEPNVLKGGENSILFSPAGSNFNGGQISITGIFVLCQVDL